MYQKFSPKHPQKEIPPVEEILNPCHLQNVKNKKIKKSW